MDKIEAQVKRMKGKSHKVGPPDKAGQQYRQWVEELYKDSVADGDRYLVTYTEHLREYHVALTLNANTRMKNARKYLHKYFDALDKQKFTEIDENLEKLFQRAMQALDKYIEQHGEPDNPLLTRLKEMLLQNYRDAKPKEEEKEEEETEEEKGEEGKGDHSPLKTADQNNERTVNDSIDASKKACDKASESAQEEEGREEGNLGNKEGKNTTTENPSENASSERGEADQARVQNPDELESAAISKSKAKEEEDGGAVDRQGDKAIKSSDATAEGKPADEDKAHRAEWDGPKGILFTRTRESTDALLDWIKETEELDAVFRPEPLVGSGDGNSKYFTDGFVHLHSSLENLILIFFEVRIIWT